MMRLGTQLAMHCTWALPVCKTRQNRLPRTNPGADRGQIGESFKSVEWWKSRQTLVKGRIHNAVQGRADDGLSMQGPPCPALGAGNDAP